MNKKILTFILSSICLLIFAYPSFTEANQYQEAIDAYNRKDYKTSYKLILPLAKKGLPKAQYSIGVLYEKGKGVNKDFKKAKKWFQFSADQGFAKAQKKLNFISKKRPGPKREDTPKAPAENSTNLNTKSLKNALNALNKKNYVIAHKLFLELAERGVVEAQYSLGLMYGKGRGISKDYSQAVKWWHLAADQGNGKAQTNLGWMYETGKGVPKDVHKAENWYQLASKQGLAKAQEKLTSLLNKTKKNLQENPASLSNSLSELNTGGISSGKDTFDVASHSPDTLSKVSDSMNDLDRLHAAMNLLDKKEFATAHKLFLVLANKGMAEAQINLGMLFESGQGVPKDYVEAIRRYRLAVDLGQIEAQEKLDLLLNKTTEAQINLGLGMRFEIGEGVPKDYVEAIRRYRLAGDFGLIEAQEKLDSLLSKTQEHLQENSASANEFKSSKEIKDIQTTTTSLPAEQNQIEPEQAKTLESTNQPTTEIKQEQLESTSDNLSELKTDSVYFDGDTVDVDGHSTVAFTETGDAVDAQFPVFESSSLKKTDPQPEFSEMFSKTTAKDSSQVNSDVITSNDLVLKHLDKWISSWENRDIDWYLSFYSKTFKGLEETPLDWRISRQVALKRNTNISIQLQNIRISQNIDNVEISFTQIFESDWYADVGVKKLVVVKNESEWNIINETWNHNKTDM